VTTLQNTFYVKYSFCSRNYLHLNNVKVWILQCPTGPDCNPGKQNSLVNIIWFIIFHSFH